MVVGLHRGHGTYASEGNLVASVAGVVERVNKLICVRPLRSRWVGSWGTYDVHLCSALITFRYNGEIGDVVVGRIIEVCVCGHVCCMCGCGLLSVCIRCNRRDGR